MQPNEPRPSTTVRYDPRYSVLGYRTTPRQRNRIHNQAVKRAKANIGKHRDPLAPGAEHDVHPSDDSVDVVAFKRSQVEWDQLLLEKYQQLEVDSVSPKLTVTSGGLRGDPFNAFPIASEGCVASAIDYCESFGQGIFSQSPGRC